MIEFLDVETFMANEFQTNGFNPEAIRSQNVVVQYLLEVERIAVRDCFSEVWSVDHSL